MSGENAITEDFCTDVTDIVVACVTRANNHNLIGVEADAPTNWNSDSAMFFSTEVVDDSPEKRGFFASIGYAFVHSFEFIKETIWGKEEVSLSSEASGESNDETSDNEMQANPSKSYFERVKNIFAWIPYFGSFFSTSDEIKKEINPPKTAGSNFKTPEKEFPAVDNVGSSNDSCEEITLEQTPHKVPTQEEIKVETAKILKKLKDQGIPRIPEEILPYLTDKDLKEICDRLVMQCHRWLENGGCPESAWEDLKKCNAELKVRQNLSKAVDDQWAVENGGSCGLGGEEKAWSDDSSDDDY